MREVNGELYEYIPSGYRFGDNQKEIEKNIYKFVIMFGSDSEVRAYTSKYTYKEKLAFAMKFLQDKVHALCYFGPHPSNASSYGVWLNPLATLESEEDDNETEAFLLH